MPSPTTLQANLDEFFRQLAEFLLEVAFVRPTPYTMSMKKVDFIIAMYKGDKVDLGYLRGEALRLALQVGKKLLPVVAHYLSVLHLPHIVINYRKTTTTSTQTTQTK